MTSANKYPSLVEKRHELEAEHPSSKREQSVSATSTHGVQPSTCDNAELGGISVETSRFKSATFKIDKKKFEQ